MNRMTMCGAAVAVVLSCMGVGPVAAQEGAATAPAAVPVDAAMQKRAEGKAEKMLKSASVTDESKVAEVKPILTGWLTTMYAWHAQHDGELTELWRQWNEARKPVPKDEFPGEVVAHKIFEVYATLKPAYEAFEKKLATVLSPEQVDAMKEAWSYSPGMKRTYNAYLQEVPDLGDKDKAVLQNQMNQAREDAMLTDNKKEIINIFKVHKVKVEEYVGSLEWAKLQKAFAAHAKAAATAPAEGNP